MLLQHDIKTESVVHGLSSFVLAIIMCLNFYKWFELGIKYSQGDMKTDIMSSKQLLE